MKNAPPIIPKSANASIIAVWYPVRGLTVNVKSIVGVPNIGLDLNLSQPDMAIIVWGLLPVSSISASILFAANCETVAITETIACLQMYAKPPKSPTPASASTKFLKNDAKNMIVQISKTTIGERLPENTVI